MTTTDADSGRGSGRRRRPRRRRVGLVLLLLAGTLLSVELVLHVKPTLLPSWYREQFPVLGVEFLRPGILAETPIKGYPVPGPQRPYTGPPPAGLIAPTPLVDPAANPDAHRYPRVVMPIDEKGFPNARVPERADVLFVGDSFAFGAGVADPPALQALVARAGDWTVYNVGIPGIGPIRERWLMEHHGLPLRPRAVVWFFFGGNDLTDVAKTRARLATGAKVYTDNPAYEPVPTFLLGDLARRWFDGLGADARPKPRMTRGVRLGHGPDADVDVWFSPLYIRLLLLDKASWRKNEGLEPALDELRAAKARLDAEGVPMLLVYLPSKPEVMLPSVADQLDVVWDMVTLNLVETPITQQQFEDAILRNLDALREIMEGFARTEKIPFLDATPFLRAVTEEGRLAYLSADTHWNDVGQQALAGPVVEALEGLGVGKGAGR